MSNPSDCHLTILQSAIDQLTDNEVFSTSHLIVFISPRLINAKIPITAQNHQGPSTSCSAMGDNIVSPQVNYNISSLPLRTFPKFSGISKISVFLSFFFFCFMVMHLKGIKLTANKLLHFSTWSLTGNVYIVCSEVDLILKRQNKSNDEEFCLLFYL